MKKAPENRGLGVWNLFAALAGAPKLLLFLRSSFLLRGGFLGCGLHRLILPKHQILRLEKSQCDSYIRCFAINVKKKMHAPIRFDLFEVAPALEAADELLRTIVHGVREKLRQSKS